MNDNDYNYIDKHKWMNRYLKSTNICSTITAAFASINIINKPRIKWRRNKNELKIQNKKHNKNEREREKEWMNQ